MSFTHPAPRPWIAPRELDHVTEPASDGWISSRGSCVRRFEQAFASYNGMAHATACSSGTTALTLALRTLGIGLGDEVIVPEFTMIATAWAVDYVGATPVFVDCGDDLTIDVDLIEEKITPRTKAIIPVHVYGRRCHMERIMTLADAHGLRVVEDSAEAHGVRPVADISCFSFDANKIITAGQGGICLTDDPGLAEQMAHLRSLAFTQDQGFLDKTLAYHLRMTSMQTALTQVERLDEILAARRALERRYDEGLRGIDGITVMPPREVLWVYDLRARHREQLREFLAGEGIETRLFFKPMSRQPGYYDPRWTSLNASRFSADGFHLPAHTGLTEREQDHIIGKIRQFHGAS